MDAARLCYATTPDLTAEQRTLFCDALAVSPQEPALRLARIERALAAIDQRSPANAMLLGTRGSLLVGMGREDDAVRAFDEALRKYPGLPPLLLQAGQALTYTDHAGDAARHWTELAKVAPELAERIEPSDLSTLIDRLRLLGRNAELRSLAAAFEAANLAADNDLLASALADELFAEARERGNVVEMRRLLPNIRNPESMRAMLADLSLRPIWSDVPWSAEERREAIVRDWISALAQERVGDDPVSGPALSALVRHLGPEPVLARFEPELLRFFDSPAHPTDPAALRLRAMYAFWVAPLANAHVIAGNEAAAERLYRRAIAFYTPFDSATRLNAEANLALFLVDRGRHGEALAIVEPAIDALEANQGMNIALLQMHAVRARALKGLDRWGEAWSSMELLRRHADRAWEVYFHSLVQLDLIEEAREALVARLRSVQFSDALRTLQPGIAAFETPSAVDRARKIADLAEDERVRAALEGKGRLLGRNTVALDGFDLQSL